MDATTGGRCHGVYVKRGYHHTVKGKIHELIVQPAMLYGWRQQITRSHVNKLEITEVYIRVGIDLIKLIKSN